MGRFWKLKVWWKARSLTRSIYSVTREFPREEQFGLTAQMRSASASIMANIAEGCGRNRKGELLRFLDIAVGSANELQSHCFIAFDQDLLTDKSMREIQHDVREVRNMIAGLIRHLKSSDS